MFSAELDKFLSENKGKKIVFTNGCFDILHKGHVTYLNEAKKLGDLLVVGLNSDASVKRLKGPERPINNEKDRQFVLSNLRSIDFVEIFDEDTPLSLIKKIMPQVLVKGGDWKIEQIVGAKEVIANGGEVFSLNFVDGYSTTSIISKIQES
ncbi:MAG TPA: D-glycero-beta-D-manno-heptose 1-phosphate adenylyltransferase [Bacteriovoracaceae bacterium]|nr:D-glycero-beta-D-manno-heptose 1-phosphate adenylyltransferase [Bacteriovoracaceae bacterium]